MSGEGTAQGRVLKAGPGHPGVPPTVPGQVRDTAHWVLCHSGPLKPVCSLLLMFSQRGESKGSCEGHTLIYKRAVMWSGTLLPGPGLLSLEMPPSFPCALFLLLWCHKASFYRNGGPAVLMFRKNSQCLPSLCPVPSRLSDSLAPLSAQRARAWTGPQGPRCWSNVAAAAL